MNRREFIKLLSCTMAASGATLFPAALYATYLEGHQSNFAISWKKSFDAALNKKPWLAHISSLDKSLSAQNLVIEGKIPTGLIGTLYRNGPAQHEINGQRYHHLFDADGMIQQFCINGENQTATYFGRFVDTAKRRKDLFTGQMSTPTFGSAFPTMSHVTKADDMNAANTSIRQHAGKLLALWEAGSAYEIDPLSLSTTGIVTWSEQTQGMPYSAHPKIDQDGSMWNFGAIGTFQGLVFYHIGASGKLLKQQTIRLPEARMVHDFMITERYLVFILAPFVFDHELAHSRLLTSYLDAHQWKKQEANWLLLVDKDNLSNVRRLELPASWIFHFGNAWQKGHWLYFDMCEYKDTSVMTQGLRDIMKGDDHVTELAKHSALKINLKTGYFEKDTLYQNVEFPIYDERFVGRKNQYTLAICNRNGNHLLSANRLVLIDLTNGQHRHFDFPENEVIEEHLFIPNKYSNKEMEGWFIGVSFDYKRMISKVNIFTASSFEYGPDAMIQLPYHIPTGFHGTFVGAT
ncbi:carotenoid oxygenase family protein [Marinomonas balearica]|uniref:Carotenoid cleavage dioxygenase n=1 Tax=Marinomonas balearica TaxID=491947 RepID=A0A4R6MDB0_9GAMM|nr:carotenoid oxygenase family protein [Marinomonas balearica]TDO99543.1 carotenoid cleavage dioxygenase [Marinomonas balearica]